MILPWFPTLGTYRVPFYSPKDTHTDTWMYRHYVFFKWLLQRSSTFSLINKCPPPHLQHFPRINSFKFPSTEHNITKVILITLPLQWNLRCAIQDLSICICLVRLQGKGWGRGNLLGSMFLASSSLWLGRALNFRAKLSFLLSLEAKPIRQKRN